MGIINERRCVAIGFKWSYTPTTIKECDVLLTVSRVNGVLSDDDPDTLWKIWQQEHFSQSYRIKLPVPAETGIDADISGIVDLKQLLGSRDASDRTSCLDRTIADLILAELDQIPLTFDRTKPQEWPIILMNGPLFPKLRGRLYYRHLNPDLPILVVTYQPPWLALLVRNLHLPSTEQPDTLGWHGPYPSEAHDSSSRFFLGTRGSRVIYHIELPSNTWSRKSPFMRKGCDHAMYESRFQKDAIKNEMKTWWVDNRRKICEELFDAKLQPSAISVEKFDSSLVILPIPLASALCFAQQHHRFENGVIKFFNLIPQLQSYVVRSGMAAATSRNKASRNNKFALCQAILSELSPKSSENYKPDNIPATPQQEAVVRDDIYGQGPGTKVYSLIQLLADSEGDEL